MCDPEEDLSHPELEVQSPNSLSKSDTVLAALIVD
jgi:hypothetical protein